MHKSSLRKLEAFVNVYAAGATSKGKRVLDIGSASYKGHVTYRGACEAAGLEYVGLDMQAGFNVDIVSKRACVYSELDDESFDYVISGQAFEHNPFFWISFAEIARVLKQGGLTMVIAPSMGSVHRFPFDCWRYYPDSWPALCAMTGLEQVETIFEPDEHRAIVEGAKWRDSAVIARKPTFESPETKRAFYRNITRLTDAFQDRDYPFEPAEPNKGPAFEEYRKLIGADVQAAE